MSINSFEYSCEYYTEILAEEALNEKVKSMEGAMKFFSKNLPGHKKFSSVVPWVTIFFL